MKLSTEMVIHQRTPRLGTPPLNGKRHNCFHFLCTFPLEAVSIRLPKLSCNSPKMFQCWDLFLIFWSIIYKTNLRALNLLQAVLNSCISPHKACWCWNPDIIRASYLIPHTKNSLVTCHFSLVAFTFTFHVQMSNVFFFTFLFQFWFSFLSFYFSHSLLKFTISIHCNLHFTLLNQACSNPNLLVLGTRSNQQSEGVAQN